ncbi:MAG: hypothetical protein C5B52_01460 [Bacteroidetes bacterium]|nr:MAG: hypothetical protein C5B52_01460 [Bacteroidota bacterium]
MEVHHHPHVEKKRFREYFLEFLMIFLAVTMGFFAENIREYFSNNERVTQLSEQLLQELKKDTATLNATIAYQRGLQKNADSVFKILRKPAGEIDSKKLEHLIEKCFRVTTFTSSSGALTSIKSQLNLKQFSGSQISNYITDYEGQLNQVKTAEAIQVQQVKEIVEKFMQLHFTADDLYALRIDHSDISGQLRKTTPDDLEDFRSAMVSIEDFNTLLMNSYNESKERALNLMQYVRKEYNIKD